MPVAVPIWVQVAPAARAVVTASSNLSSLRRTSAAAVTAVQRAVSMSMSVSYLHT